MEGVDAQEARKQQWLAIIKDWNLRCKLPGGLDLGEGKITPDNPRGQFKDYGTEKLRDPHIKKPGVSWAMQSAEREHPDANFITRVDLPDGTSTISYHFKIFSNDIEKRGIYTPAIFDINVSGKHADLVLRTLSQHPTLLDSLFSSKFPRVTRNLDKRGSAANAQSKDTITGIKPWKELIFLPDDVNTSNWKQKMQVLHRKQ